MATDFVHLHVHTEFSLLDGLSKISKLLIRAKEHGQKSLAITDHGAMYGAIEFYKKAQKEEIKPIIGCEIYTSAHSHTEKVRQDAFHLLLLCKDKEGYENLMKIVTIGLTKGFYYKPRVDKEILNKYHQGLIVTTGCPAGRVQKLLMDESYEAGKRELIALQQIFGKENTYIELQRHHLDIYAGKPDVPSKVKEDLIDFQQKINKVELDLIKLSRDQGIPLVATNDVHYVDIDDAAAQDAIVCVQTGKLVSDITRLRYIDTPDFYLKSTEEMAKIYSDLPEAISNTVSLADKVNLEIKIGSWYFPRFEIPSGKTASEVLRDQSYQGAQKKFPIINDEITKRLDYELDIIDQKGYSPYFLIYADLVNHCNEDGIYTNTRGSAAGSLVSYCCGITTVDPLRFNLPFERFLNPFRPSLPDIDLDISDDRRDDLIEYIKKKYGEEKVGQVCTFGTMKARAAVRDVGRVLGIPYSKVDRIAKIIPPPKQGFPMPLSKALKITPDLDKIYREDPEVKHLIDLSQKVENNTRHISVHAAAVVISPDELTKFTPLQQEPGGGDKIITQYEMHACEDVGLVKLDILGIRNLSILADALRLVKKLRGKSIAKDDIPLDDSKTFELLSQGETFGVFQLGSAGMTHYLIELRPERIEDIMQMVALYRPGPMSFIPEYIKRKHDPSTIQYLDPRMEKFLKTSYGILVYQDDVIYCALELAGYNWGEADKFRKAIGKKIPEEMQAQKDRFINGCIEGGMKQSIAQDLFAQIETFAAYGFNKAHAASYGIVAFWTAYVKAHYPVEYMTSLMSAEAEYTDKLSEAIAECERLGIRVLLPDVNESLSDFTAVDISKDKWAVQGRAREEGKAIRFGLNAIKNVGAAAIGAILTVRKNGSFKSLTDFMLRVDQSKVNKKVLESLIKAGAFDHFGKRSALLEAIQGIKERINKHIKNKSGNQTGLFDSDSSAAAIEITDNLPDLPELPSATLLAYEKALLGFYITDHPARNIARSVASKITHKINQIDKVRHQNQTVTVAGLINSIRLVNTKKNNSRMAFVTLEDETGIIDLVIFPKSYEQYEELLISGKGVLVGGKVDNRDDRLSIIVDSIKPVIISTGPDREIYIPRGTAKEILEKISILLKASPGEERVVIVIPNGGEPKKIPLNFTIKFDERLDSQLKALLD